MFSQLLLVFGKPVKHARTLCDLPFKNTSTVKLGNPFLWVLLWVCSKNRAEVACFAKHICRSAKAICLTLFFFLNTLAFHEQEQGFLCLSLLQ